MLADTGIQQLAVQLCQPACRHALGLGGIPFAQPAVEQQLEQHGNESRRSSIAGHIGEIEQRETVIKTLEIEKVARKIERRLQPVVTADTIDGLPVSRQQLALDLPPGLLIQTQQLQMSLQAL